MVEKKKIVVSINKRKKAFKTLEQVSVCSAVLSTTHLFVPLFCESLFFGTFQSKIWKTCSDEFKVVWVANYQKLHTATCFHMQAKKKGFS